MKKIVSLCLLFPLFMSQAWAWGQTGHRVVGFVAQNHLKNNARKKVNTILNFNSLAEVSNWMDDIKSDTAYNHTHDWHWVTIPEGTMYEQTQKNPKGDLIMKLEEIISALKAGNLDRTTEQQYLKFLVHLIGDLHQPLHVGGKDDTGGNAVKLQWFGQPSNLHRVWDSDMIDGKNLSYTELAGFLGQPSKSQIQEWQSLSVRDWAYASQSRAPQVYNFPKDGRLGYRYSYENFDTVQLCLLQAGVHLAGILNEIYG
ncbi:S1/P1 nuclease [Telluribacter sp.]|jgi:hypothetical protein|uniref:S1/P1 nuclease n=1 Tax=Telluribacter sp. TaxID=1978767 RepID=UPI002E161185|nr:S1/P1 nuclease [Telluribacter sp.]